MPAPMGGQDVTYKASDHVIADTRAQIGERRWAQGIARKAMERTEELNRYHDCWLHARKEELQFRSDIKGLAKMLHETYSQTKGTGRKDMNSVIGAFLRKEKCKHRNTISTGPDLYLHGSRIMTWDDEGHLWATLAGYPSRTTRSRINAVIADHPVIGKKILSFYQDNSKQFVALSSGPTDKVQVGATEWVDLSAIAALSDFMPIKIGGYPNASRK